MNFFCKIKNIKTNHDILKEYLFRTLIIMSLNNIKVTIAY